MGNSSSSIFRNGPFSSGPAGPLLPSRTPVTTRPAAQKNPPSKLQVPVIPETQAATRAQRRRPSVNPALLKKKDTGLSTYTEDEEEPDMDEDIESSALFAQKVQQHRFHITKHIKYASGGLTGARAADITLTDNGKTLRIVFDGKRADVLIDILSIRKVAGSLRGNSELDVTIQQPGSGNKTVQLIFSTAEAMKEFWGSLQALQQLLTMES